MPVVGEVFLASATEEVQPFAIPVPRLVHQELAALRSVAGVVGVKEYFGLLPDRIDPNLEMAGQVFAAPDIGVDEAGTRIAAAYGEGKEDVLGLWAAAADGVELFPWDVSWKLRHIGWRAAWHEWTGYRLAGHLVDSPSWCSTRRAHFMTTENDVLHPWFYEDMGLRCGLSADRLAEAIRHGEHSIGRVPAGLRAAVEAWVRDLRGLRQAVRSYQCHILATLAAGHIREASASGGAVPPAQIDRLRELLRLDAVNQADAPPASPGTVPASTMLAAFEKAPLEWVGEHLR